MPEPRMVSISQIDGYLKMLLKYKNNSSTAKILPETKFAKNKRLPIWNWRRKQKLAKEIAKAVREKVYKTPKSMEYGELSST